MRYEIYVDTLIFINFTMNLYLLMWLNKNAFHTATWMRLIVGAGAGAVGFVITCLGGGIPVLRIMFGMALGISGMILFPFRVRSLKLFLKLFRQLAVSSFVMGGGIMFIMNLFPGIRMRIDSVVGIAALGGIFFLLCSEYGFKRGENQKVCKVTLEHGGIQLSVQGLLDSGNSLTEPISGKPVCVLDKSLQAQLWGENTEGVRVIPYRSIGKEHGLMLGYPLESLLVEVNHIPVEVKGVYIAVSEQKFSAEGNEKDEIKIIINPEIMKNAESRNRRQLGEII